MRKLPALGLVLGSALLLPAVASGEATQYASATLGTVAPSAGNPAASTRTASPTSAPTARGSRRVPRHPGTAAAPLTAAPRANGSNLTSAPGSLLTNFNGVSSRDSANTNFGAEFEPPDQGLCTGNGFVMEMTNSAYTIYKPNGSVVTGPFNVNGPFNEGLIEFTSDPRCHYDPATKTWFAVILFISADNTRSTIDVAVNNTGDPTKLWKSYKIDTTARNGHGHTGCPCFGDQPTLGIDQYNLYVTTNEYSIVGPDFNGAQVYAFAKPDLVAENPVHFVHFDNLSIGGAQANSIQPALTTGSPPAEYFLNSLDPNGTFDQRIGVWAMTKRQAVATGGTPLLSSRVLTSEAYGIPPATEQKGSASTIDSGDDRMQQTQFINGSVWGELGTAVTIPTDPATRAGAAWFKVTPALSGNTIGSGTSLAAQGYLALKGNGILYPAVQVAPNGNAVMGFSLSGKSRFPSTGYAVMPKGATSFGNVKVTASGTGPYDPNATRWGDYSWAVLDPSGNSVWMADEYIPPKASQTQDGRRNWGTRVFQVSATG